MTGKTIGELARLTGLATSAIRYYESEGLIPPPRRRSNARRYDDEAAARLEVIMLCREAGFTIAETLTFVSPDVEPQRQWRELATRKLKDIEARMADLRRMRRILKTSFQCGCLRLEDCERAMVERRRSRARQGQSDCSCDTRLINARPSP